MEVESCFADAHHPWRTGELGYLGKGHVVRSISRVRVNANRRPNARKAPGEIDCGGTVLEGSADGDDRIDTHQVGPLDRLLRIGKQAIVGQVGV